MVTDYSDVKLETKDLILKKAEFEDWKTIYYNLWRHKESAKAYRKENKEPGFRVLCVLWVELKRELIHIKALIKSLNDANAGLTHSADS